MLWFFTPYSTVNQVFPILTTQCTEEGIHPLSSVMETINTKQYVLELLGSNYDPAVSGLHAKLLLNVIQKNLYKEIIIHSMLYIYKCGEQ